MYKRAKEKQIKKCVYSMGKRDYRTVIQESNQREIRIKFRLWGRRQHIPRKYLWNIGLYGVTSQQTIGLLFKCIWYSFVFVICLRLTFHMWGSDKLEHQVWSSAATVGMWNSLTRGDIPLRIFMKKLSTVQKATELPYSPYLQAQRAGVPIIWWCLCGGNATR
jgi:hypothetical protein